MSQTYIPTVLSIAGSDSYGGAGIQVDSKTIHALGGYAFTCITALTAQNSTGVKAVNSTSQEMFKEQLESILDDINVDAVKIGMLANAEIISVLVDIIDKYKLKNIILDTVLVSSSGKALLEPYAVNIMIKELFPRVDLITPNIPEVNTLLDTNYSGNEDEIEAMAKGLFVLGAKAVLIKGGHSQDNQNATDYLVEQNFKILPFTTTRLHTTHTHGTGCVLSSAVATHLAKGDILVKSVELSKAFLYKALRTAPIINFKYIEENDTRKEPLL